MQVTNAAPPVDYRALVSDQHVHGSLYTDPAIFADEMERIFNQAWVFVGHTSEIAEPNDYVRKTLGRQDVIMTRDRDGEVHVLHNRCAHRGSIVCNEPRGNSSAFRCPYHGWTFRNTGKLVGYPFREGYGSAGPKLDLARAPRVAAHQGFVFASMTPDGPSLPEFLGPATEEFDRLARLSPEGEISLDCGWIGHRLNANWKLLFENDADGYHPQFAHRSLIAATNSRIGDLYTDKSPVTAHDLGHGHSIREMRPVYRSGPPLGWAGAAGKVPDYEARMHEVLGPDAASVLTDGPPNLMVFPNLAIMDIHISIFQPLAPDLSVQHVTAIQWKGAPDLNRRQLQQTVASVGPAGMFLADDAEMHERVQLGLQARQPEWVDVSRGLQRETRDERGQLTGRVTDETGIRSFWHEYLQHMNSAATT